MRQLLRVARSERQSARDVVQSLRGFRSFAYVPFIIVLAVLAPIAWPAEGSSDVFWFWYAGRLVLTGASPYDQPAWERAAEYGPIAHNVVDSCVGAPEGALCLWLYPPHTAMLFAPFGLLEVHAGVLLLAICFVLAAVVGVVWLVQWAGPRSEATRALALCACAVAHPFVFDIRGGHFEGLGLIGILSVATGLRAGRTLPVVAGALLLSLKPHLFLVVAALTVVVLVRQRRRRTLAVTALALVGVVGAAFLRYPDAIPAILGSGAKTAVGWASTWSFSATLFADRAPVGFVVVFGCAALAFLVAVRFRPRDRGTDALIAACTALSLMLVPYLHPYDLMLTLPAFVLSLTLAERLDDWRRGALMSVTVLALSAGSWAAIVASTQQTTVQGIPGAMPLVALALLAIVSLTIRARPSRARVVVVPTLTSGQYPAGPT